MNSNNISPSLIKWTGSKRSQASSIAHFFPADAPNYFEPFLGGGSVLFYATQHFAHCFASDIYRPLIEIWDTVKMMPNAVVESYTDNWLRLQQDFPNFYYEVRDRFNLSKKGLDLLFLTRTCVNGIIRFNEEGQFNNSLHLSRRGMTPKRFASIVALWNDRLKTTSFSTADYSDILGKVSKGDFVYLDPPYANSHNRYIDDLNIDRLLIFLEQLNSKDVRWALSFDGTRGDNILTYEIPKSLYRFHTFLKSGYSSVSKVLNSTVEPVYESLYLNFEPQSHKITQLKFAL